MKIWEAREAFVGKNSISHWFNFDNKEIAKDMQFYCKFLNSSTFVMCDLIDVFISILRP